MTVRLSLLALTAGAAGLSAVANAVGGAPEPTRLGTSIASDMAARDRQMAQRNRTLDMREQAARAAEQRLRAAGAANAAAQQGARPGAPPPPSEEERFGELARIYQAMKPKAAAQVFEQLALDIQVEVAGRMRERSTAAIMAAMTPAKAAALTVAMARKGSDRPGWTALAPAAGAR